jgi:hypothetical protein
MHMTPPRASLIARTSAADVLPLVLAASVPLVFLHVRYQLHLSVGIVVVCGADLAVAATVGAAAIAGLRFGWKPFAPGRLLWILALFLLLFVVSCFWRPLEHPLTHLVTALKAVEYALLAPAAVLLLRRQADLNRFLTVFVAWAAAAAGWGMLMFLGVVNDPDGPRPGQREVSFLGHQDLGVFTGAALAVGFASVALGARRRLGLLALGVVGVILDASVFVYLGTIAAALTAASSSLARREAGAGPWPGFAGARRHARLDHAGVARRAESSNTERDPSRSARSPSESEAARVTSAG